MGYPSQFRAEEFPVYGNSGSKPLPVQHADFVLFDDANFASNRSRDQSQLNWVYNHSLLVVEAKKPDEIPIINTQPQFYSAWTRAVAYILIDGNKIKGYFLGKTTADIPIVNCDVSTLVDNEDFLQFSFENIRHIKEMDINETSTCWKWNQYTI